MRVPSPLAEAQSLQDEIGQAEVASGQD